MRAAASEKQQAHNVAVGDFINKMKGLEKQYENILHGQSALQIKLALLSRENTVVTSVPYHVDRGSSPDGSTKR